MKTGTAVSSACLLFLHCITEYGVLLHHYFTAGRLAAQILQLSKLINTVIQVAACIGPSLFIGVLTAYAFGLVGFVDDYIKVVKKRNLGLMARYKIVAQVLITGAYL